MDNNQHNFTNYFAQPNQTTQNNISNQNENSLHNNQIVNDNYEKVTPGFILIIAVIIVVLLLVVSNIINQVKKKSEPESVLNPSSEVVEPKPVEPEPVTPNPEPKPETPIVDEKPTEPVQPTVLVCTKTESNQYGTYKYTTTYNFKGENFTTATQKLSITLKSKYRSQRDALIDEIQSQNRKFVKLDGITEFISKRSDGFTYTLKVNANKLSKSDLAKLGYKARNLSSVRVYAYNNGFSCK